MFGSKLKRGIEPKCLAGVFFGCSAGIHGLGKKIGSYQKVDFSQKIKNSPDPIFLLSLRTPAEQPPNA
jgi:hypothetical protein